MRHYDLDITLVVAGMPMSGDTISAGKSLGGSETCGIQLAEALVKRGHHLTLFCNTEKPHEANGVLYMPLGWAQNRNNGQGFPKGFFDYARSTPTDAIIVQRIPAFMGFEFQSKVNILWQHDLATRTGPSNFHQTLWNINKIVVPSEFMRKQYQSIHGGPERLYSVVHNGIDVELIDKGTVPPRDRYRLTYTARPERGLDILLRDVFPQILAKEPRAKLYISRYEDPATLPLYTQLEQFAQQFNGAVVNMGNLGKAALYEAYRQARLYLYPTQFEEIFCVTLAEVAACGVPMVSSWKAALPETAGGTQVLLKEDGTPGRLGDPTENGFKQHKPEYLKAFAEEAVNLIHDDDRWEQLSKMGRKRAEELSWDGPVAQWETLIREEIAKRCDDPRRMVKHFLVTSDVVGARKYANKTGNEKLIGAVDRHIAAFAPFLNAQGQKEQKIALAEFYEKRSGGRGANYQTAFYADQEPRLQVFIEWMKLKIAEGKIPADGTLLDFGCAHGGYVRAISNAFPSLRVVGVDVSPSLIRCANELLKSTIDGKPAFAHPENVDFRIADEDGMEEISRGLSVVGAREMFDVVFCAEVLEHLPHSEEVATKLERLCRPGGYMAFTVPHGYRERDEFVTKGVPPVHVRAFDVHDVREMFGQKPEYSVLTFSDHAELGLDKTMPGWFMATYQNDQKGVPEIDWQRRFELQGPRDTLAVCMIVHNSEAVLHRCLRSVARLADQIVVVDNGPSYDRTIEVAQEYTDDVRAGTSPFWCYAHATIHDPGQIVPSVCDMAGFETPRNESIDGVWADWILWIDADEQLLETGSVPKYLRPNVYNGYALQQHHISIDPPGAIKRDIPVRLYRSNVGMKFYGLVHEHAELGINKGVGPDCIVLGDFHIHHDGYLTETIRRGRFHRNLKLLECDRLKHPDRLLGIYLYEIRDNVHMARYALEQSGGLVTPDVQKHCWTVINNFRKHFLDADNMLFEEGINYYSDALAILGLGLEVATDLDVKKSGANLGAARRFRVMDKEEAKMIINRKIEALAAPLEGPYVQ